LTLARKEVEKVGVTAGAGNLLKWIMENAPNVLQPFMVPTFTFNPIFLREWIFFYEKMPQKRTFSQNSGSKI